MDNIAGKDEARLRYIDLSENRNSTVRRGAGKRGEERERQWGSQFARTRDMRPM